jgi:DNA-binding transcriptional ArsR family regulator
MSSRVDLIFHPIRARIIVQLSGRQAAAKELAQSMPDIPRTTLYRHLNALTEGGILNVVEENPIRGTVERVYALDRAAADLTQEELGQMDKEDYERIFTLFATSLLGDFSRYLNSREPENIDLDADGIKFGKAMLYLSDEEFEALQLKVYGSIEAVLGNEPSTNRKPRIAAIAFIPASEDVGQIPRQVNGSISEIG